MSSTDLPDTTCHADSSTALVTVTDFGSRAGLGSHQLFTVTPASSLTLVGVTGTNGKTTCATLLFRLVPRAGLRLSGC